MKKDLISILEYLEREKGIQRTVIVEAIEESLREAALKSVQGAANASVSINPKTGSIEVYCEKEIVKTVTNPAKEISVEDAQQIDPDSQLGQFIDEAVTPEDFGRIAAKKAKNVIAEKLRHAEKEVVYEKFKHRVGELITGTVKRFVRGSHVLIDLGKISGIMPLEHYPRTEKHHVGDKLTVLLYAMEEADDGGLEIILSRSAPEFVQQLMFQEVPELEDGTISIRKIVRDAGYRTKLSVETTEPKVDPVGACVGMRGIRVKNVIRELNNEKIDIIPYDEDPVELLQNALAPIEIRKISVNEEENTISIVVPDDDYAVAIGKRGMNARLNGELVGYELEIQRMHDYTMTMAIQRRELADSDDPSLDLPLESIEGINKLLFEHLIEEGYNTLRTLLNASTEDLSKIEGITSEMAENILEKIRKQRM